MIASRPLGSDTLVIAKYRPPFCIRLTEFHSYRWVKSFGAHLQVRIVSRSSDMGGFFILLFGVRFVTIPLRLSLYYSDYVAPFPIYGELATSGFPEFPAPE